MEKTAAPKTKGSGGFYWTGSVSSESVSSDESSLRRHLYSLAIGKQQLPPLAHLTIEADWRLVRDEPPAGIVLPAVHERIERIRAGRVQLLESDLSGRFAPSAETTITE